jgi:antitoxin FitA
MRLTCANVHHMTMIQIRHVPEEVHRALKVRAAAAGMTLSDYLLRELRELVRKPTLEELFDRIERDEGAAVETDEVVDGIRRDREERSKRIVTAFDEGPGRR